MHPRHNSPRERRHPVQNMPTLPSRTHSLLNSLRGGPGGILGAGVEDGSHPSHFQGVVGLDRGVGRSHLVLRVKHLVHFRLHQCGHLPDLRLVCKQTRVTRVLRDRGSNACLKRFRNDGAHSPKFVGNFIFRAAQVFVVTIWIMRDVFVRFLLLFCA